MSRTTTTPPRWSGSIIGPSSPQRKLDGSPSKSLAKKPALFNSRQVEKVEGSVSKIPSKELETEIYKNTLRNQSRYMRQRQIGILEKQSTNVKESIEKILTDNIHVYHRQIKDAANQLTDYKRFRAFKMDIGEMAHRKADAKAAALTHPPRKNFEELSHEDKQAFKEGSAVLSLSFSGFNTAPSFHQMPEGHSLLEDKDIPLALQMFYDDKTGLLQTPSGCKAFLMKSSEGITMIFTGTEAASQAATGRKHTVQADIVQRIGGYSTMYHDASGITKMMLDHSDKKLKLIGFSLGGGQAQYALATNVERDGNRMRGWIFNSAALSASTLGAIGPARIEKAHDLILGMRVEGDPISPGSKIGEKFKGVLLGQAWTLKRPGASAVNLDAHRVKFLRAEIDKAMEN